MSSGVLVEDVQEDVDYLDDYELMLERALRQGERPTSAAEVFAGP